MGNPIVRNDCIGIMIGERLAGEAEFRKPGITILPFCGAPLDFVLLLSSYRQCIIIDAVITGQAETGTVMHFTAEELGSLLQHTYPHAINIPEALQIGKRFNLPLPASLLLLGIEVEEISTFGEELSPELASRWEEIYSTIVEAVRSALKEGVAEE